MTLRLRVVLFLLCRILLLTIFILYVHGFIGLLSANTWKMMTRMKSKFKKRADEDITNEELHIIFGKLPLTTEKYLGMKVNNGTKIRNVLKYALKEFSKFDHVLWTGCGKGGINKVITCVEIFKRKKLGLHQLTKLRFLNKYEDVQLENKKQVAEINILLSKKTLEEKSEAE